MEHKITCYLHGMSTDFINDGSCNLSIHAVGFVFYNKIVIWCYKPWKNGWIVFHPWIIHDNSMCWSMYSYINHGNFRTYPLVNRTGCPLRGPRCLDKDDHLTAHCWEEVGFMSHWRTMVGPAWWTNHRKTIGKCWFNGILMGFNGGLMGY